MRGQGYFKAAVILVSLFAASFLSSGLIPYLLCYIALGLLLIDFLWSAACKRTAADSWIESSDALVEINSLAGTKVKVYTEIVNNSPWPIPWVQIWIEMPMTFGLPDNLCCYTFSLRSFERKVVCEELECKIRGSFEWGRGVIKGGGFLGVFTCSGPFGNPRQLEVLPKIIYLAGSDIRGWKAKMAAGLLGRQGRGHEVFSVRKYDIADGLSRIHWKISAKTQNLFVKNNQQAEYLNTVLFLDNGRERHFDNGPEGSFEQAVSLTASVAAALMKAGHGTELFLCTPKQNMSAQELHKVNFGQGKANFIKILKQLTHAVSIEASPLAEALGRVMSASPKAHFMLISGEIDNAAVEILLSKRAKGHAITIFLLLLETFGKLDVDIKDREKLISRLRNSGIPVTTVEKDSDLRQILGRPGYGVG